MKQTRASSETQLSDGGSNRKPAILSDSPLGDASTTSDTEDSSCSSGTDSARVASRA